MMDYSWARSIIIRQLTQEQIAELHKREIEIDRFYAPFEIRLKYNTSKIEPIRDEGVEKINEMIRDVIRENYKVLFKTEYDPDTGVQYHIFDWLEKIHYLDKAIHCKDFWEYQFARKQNSVHDNNNF